MIVLDTHIWVNWIVYGDKGVSRAILEVMDSQPSLAVSAISCFVGECRFGVSFLPGNGRVSD